MTRFIRLALVSALLPRPGHAQAPAYQFSDVAHVAAVCADDYTQLDNCANKWNPPKPSILRDLEWPRPADADVAVSRLDYDDAAPYGRLPVVPPAGRTEALPSARSTTDGRLLLRTVYPWSLSFIPYRPENVQHDWKTGSAPALPRRFHEKLHPLIWLDPRANKTRWSNLNPAPSSGQNPRVPVAIHSTICENNDVSVAAGERSPRACSATYSVCNHAQIENCPAGSIATAEYSGDCYDLTLIVDTSSDDSGDWEMRSVNLTVFVPNAKALDTGESGSVLPDGRSVLVYPRMLRPKEPDPWVLPEWSFKKVGNQNNFRRGYNPDHEWPDLNNKVAACGSPLPAARPNWCQFLDQQKRRTDFFFDVDGDPVMHTDSNPGSNPIWHGDRGNNRFLFAPVTTGDGRLLLIESGAGFGMLYSYNSNNTSAPCNIDEWRNFHPISHMPHDPELIKRYEIARAQTDSTGQQHPFRDSLGNDVPYGALDVVGYPWIDREGKNLIVSVGNVARDGYWARDVRTQGLEATCEVPCSAPDGDVRVCSNPDRGAGARAAVIGAWTQGKLVVLDNMLNFTDFNGAPNNQADFAFRMRLYEKNDVWVTPKGSQQINSFENRLFPYDAHNPVLPFDVVWTVQSDTYHNAELVFDEYHNNRAFVVAHMNAPSEWRTGLPQDGFVATYKYPDRLVRNGETADFRFTTNPLLQNAAGSTKWHDPDGVVGPATLRLRGGARVEPVAMGGVLGKGVYLDGNNDFIDMGYKIDPALRDAGWYFGLWIDPRDASDVGNGTPRTIFFFPDNSSIGLQRWNGRYRVSLRHAPTGQSKGLYLPELIGAGRYFHLGIRIDTRFEVPVTTRATRATRQVRIYVDGTPVGAPIEFVMDGFKMESGALGFQPMTAVGQGEWTWMSVGDPGPQFAGAEGRRSLRAWVDELRIYALRAEDGPGSWFDEFICNTALGSLVDIAGTSTDPRVLRLQKRAERYDKPTVICEQLKLESYTEPLDFPPQYGQRLCVDRQHKSPDPNEGGRCLRRKRLGLADGKHNLTANSPRPPFSDLPFCTSCHVLDHPFKRHDGTQVRNGGLDLSALSAGGVLRYIDPRRQPMNVPATLSGVLPPPINAPALPPSTDVYTLDHFFDGGPRIAPHP